MLRYQAAELLGDMRLRNKAEPSAGRLGHLVEAIEAVAQDLGKGLQAAEDRDATENMP